MSSFPENLTVSQQNDRELDWQAFLFVSGEMSPEEAAVFERLLEENQEACEAVAAAVGLVSSLAAAAPMVSDRAAVPLGRSPGARVRGRSWAALAAAVALAAGGGSYLALRPQATVERDLAAGDSSYWLPDLNAAPVREWMSEWNSIPQERGWADEDELADDPAGEHEALISPGSEVADLAVPGWMLAAMESGHDRAIEEN